MIPDYICKNFETLQKAFKAGHAAIMDVTRKSDGQAVTLICMINHINNEYVFVPVAEMISYADSPYDLYIPPEDVGGYGELSQ